MPSIADEHSDFQILEAVVAPDVPSLSMTVARAGSGMQFSDRQQREIHRLLDKNNAGTITPAELSKLHSYTRIGNLLSLLKAKARSSPAA